METDLNLETDNIFQASDLSAKRRQVMNTARSGFARIRDTDGTGLVLLPQRSFEFLRSLGQQLTKIVTLDAALQRPRKDRRPADYGELAWLTAFDEDDQETFRSEFLSALSQALAIESVAPADACIREWRVTARALANEKVRRALTSAGEPEAAFEEVKRPA